MKKINWDTVQILALAATLCFVVGFALNVAKHNPIQQRISNIKWCRAVAEGVIKDDYGIYRSKCEQLAQAMKEESK